MKVTKESLAPHRVGVGDCCVQSSARRSRLCGSAMARGPSGPYWHALGQSRRDHVFSVTTITAALYRQWW